MRTLILTGIREELEPFLNKESHKFRKDLRLYQLNEYPGVFCQTAGPGVTRKKEIRRWIREIQPECIISAGLVGLLDSENNIKRGSLVPISSIVGSDGHMILKTTTSGLVLTSVNSPIFYPSDRIEVMLNRGADVCDMETENLLSLIEETTVVKRLALIKILGDRPEDGKLYKNEAELRNISFTQWLISLISLKRESLLFDYPILINRKKYQYRNLTNQIRHFLKNRDKEGLSTDRAVFNLTL